MPALLDAGPASVTWYAVVSSARTDAFALCVDATLLALAVSYTAGLRRDPARGRGSQPAIASFAAGLVCLFVALGSGLAGARLADPSVEVGQHVLLMMVAPPLLVLGRPGLAFRVPLRLWRIRRPTGEAGGGAARAVSRLVSAAMRAASGIASWPLYYGSMAAYFLTPAYAASLRDPTLLDVTQVGFVAVGVLFWAGLAGAGREGVRRSSAYRLAGVIAGMPIETAVGLALVLWPRPLAPGETLASTHAAGLLLWLASMFTSGVALAVLLVQWCISDARRADLHEALAIPATAMGSDDGAARSRP